MDTDPPVSGDAMDLVERLRAKAVATSEASKLLSESKAARNRANGEPGALYEYLRPEQTDEWQAAAEIERLRSQGGAPEELRYILGRAKDALSFYASSGRRMIRHREEHGDDDYDPHRSHGLSVHHKVHHVETAARVFDEIEVMLSAAPQPPVSQSAPEFDPARIREVMRENDGFWRTCSGCHESEDGHDVGVYPFSELLQCKIGGGCSECGGLGFYWDAIDYSDMAKELSVSPPEGGAGWRDISSAPEEKGPHTVIAICPDCEASMQVHVSNAEGAEHVRTNPRFLCPSCADKAMGEPQSTQAMREGLRGQARPRHCDFDRAVVAVVNDLEGIYHYVSRGFMTCSASGGAGSVEVKFSSVVEAQALHRALLGGIPSPPGQGDRTNDGADAGDGGGSAMSADNPAANAAAACAPNYVTVTIGGSKATPADYERVLAEHQKLVHKLDVAVNGWNGAAARPSLCDIIAQINARGLVTAERLDERLSAERSRVIEECATLAGTAEDDDDGIDRQLRKRIAAAIRDLGKQTGGADAG